MERRAVLVVDDEEGVRFFLSEYLSNAGYQVRTAASGAQAIEMLASGSFDAVLLDILMPEMNGLEVLKAYRESGGTAPVVVLSALSSSDDAVRAMRLGASDYLAKPFESEEVDSALKRALGTQVFEAEEPKVEMTPALTPPLLKPEEERSEGGRGLVSVSASMHRARRLAERIADSDVPVLLLGESGTGKEMIAREIHQKSRRHGRPFIKVNCAALPSELLESELFGHEKGAFTGATAEKPGKFELADQGTIFLDEIGEMPIRLQAKLLQVLQDEEFFRVGGKRSVRVDARVVVATNRELEREIEFGNFREDLYYRLNVVAIRLPPLRDRKEDIVPLVEHFLKKHDRKNNFGPADLPSEVLRAFVAYDWPGNVRELENMVRRLVVLKDPALVMDELQGSRGANLALSNVVNGSGPRSFKSHSVDGQNHLTSAGSNPFAAPQPPPPAPNVPEEEMSLKEIGKRAAMLAEREAMLAMLQRTAWNKRKAAGKLRISYKALLYKIKEAGIVDPRSNAEF